MSERVIVTGANGFIGSTLVKLLVKRGARVGAVVEPGVDASALDGVDCDRLTADIADTPALEAFCRGAKTVYHLAAIYSLWMEDPTEIYRVNVGGTVSAVTAAWRAGAERIVYTSSVATVGVRDDGEPSDEGVAFNLFRSANDYVLSKVFAEQAALQLARAGAPVVVVNPGFVFGAGDRGPTPTGRMILNVLRGKLGPGHLPGGFNAVDVDSVAEAHIQASERGNVGERYILGGRNMTLADFQKLVGQIAGVSVPSRTLPKQVALAFVWGAEQYRERIRNKPPAIPFSAARYASETVHVDSTKAKRELGFRPAPLEQTVMQAIAWFREHGYVRSR